MSVERKHREAMAMDNEPVGRPGFLGALLEDERKLVLVPLDPREPWAAFRRMRAWMKGSKPKKASVDVFEAPGRLERSADVIPLRRREKRIS